MVGLAWPTSRRSPGRVRTCSWPAPPSSTVTAMPRPSPPCARSWATIPSITEPDSFPVMTPAVMSVLADQGYNRVPLVRQVLADLDTPLSTYLKLGRGLHTYFFESVQGGEKWGRYSIIGLPCRTVLRVVGNHITVETDGVVVEKMERDDPFVFVDEFKQRYRVAPLQGHQRFSGGLVGYF